MDDAPLSDRLVQTERAMGCLTVVLLVGYVVSSSLLSATMESHGTRAGTQYLAEWSLTGTAADSRTERRSSTTTYVNYGALFDVVGRLLARVSPLDLFETRHLLSGCFGLLGLAYAYRLATYLATPLAGFLATLFLVLTPVYYGHAFNNPKDIPFAALFLVALYYLIRTISHFPAIPWSLTLRLGIAVGAALGVRFAGIVLVGYFALAFLVWFATAIWKRSVDGGWRAVVLSYRDPVSRGVDDGVAGHAGVVAPGAGPSYRTPIQTVRVMRNFPWPNTVRFRRAGYSRLGPAVGLSATNGASDLARVLARRSADR